jgi:hypothetical protein
VVRIVMASPILHQHDDSVGGVCLGEGVAAGMTGRAGGASPSVMIGILAAEAPCRSELD